MIRAILFDVDGVLLDSFEANLKFFQDLMVHLGYRKITKEEYRPMFHFPMREVIQVATQAPAEEIEKIWKAGRARVVPYPVELLRMPDGTADVIKNLHETYRLGIVTGRVPETIFELPELHDLKKYFEVVVHNLDTTNHKPYPEPLLLAARRLALEPTECIYIGDVETDAQAARAANMSFILYTVADDFTAIPNLIEKTVRGGRSATKPAKRRRHL